MGAKTSIDAPEPDPNIGLAQKELSELSRRQMDFWERDIWPGLKEQSAQQQKLSEEQVGLNMEAQRRQMAIAEEQYQRQKTVFEPLQNEIIAEARAYDTEANRERIAGEAMGDVSTQFEIQRQNDRMRSAQYGIDPTSGRYRGMTEATDITEAATKASAANRARTAAEQLGWAKKMDAIGLGSGIFGNQATSTGLALNAGNAAIGAGQVPISNYGAMGSSLSGATSTAMGGWSNVGQLGVGKYNADVSAYNAQQQAAASSSAGLGSALGSIAGAAASLYGTNTLTAAIASRSDIRTKENIEVVGMLPNGLTIYEFDYKPEFKDSLLAGHGRFRGLMAHEVERVIPNAVFTTADGYKAVDYSMVI